MILTHHTTGRTARLVVAVAAAGLLTLTACGDKGSSGTDSPAVTTVSPTSDITDTSSPATDDTVAAGTPTTKPKAGSGSTAGLVDPQLEQSIAEVDALLNDTDKDLQAAQAAQANGG